MKPPWKYLAQLLSRQRSSGTADEAGAPASAQKLVEIELRPAATILLSSQEAISGTERVDGEESEDLAPASASIENEIVPETPNLPLDYPEAAKAEVTKEKAQSNSDLLEERPEVEAAAHLPKLRQARSKIAKTVLAFEIPGAIADLPISAASSNRDPFFENATSLDEDIKHLKDLLAQKLRIQKCPAQRNAQALRTHLSTQTIIREENENTAAQFRRRNQIGTPATKNTAEIHLGQYRFRGSGEGYRGNPSVYAQRRLGNPGQS
ncbi:MULTISPECIES: hypothetical protein [Rhizobium]|uniref:Uncharacterized protein n=1 Tax=Rhizobium tumorigenes TaxID=2041385 RepID=A0AAF1KUA2_9HYPH|nr:MULTISPECIES: hypothetical protein [Rhizobium]MBO9102009.1 hypothetical protein [Rhizobium sp. L58/93]MBO9172202.1 hypothetical protein [Rhizobium sp. L245/93]MBO9187940.1 hypothetical protein [Rhizobium sp. E27B/91]QXZ87616.1 hypothetical protein J5287_28480 [Rhizobium sp. K1/93]QXZ93657.1 hypothetical protein J5280_28480 [Rhizobium sp. K15/93]